RSKEDQEEEREEEAMAAVSASTLSASVAATAPAASLKSEFSGVQVQGIPSLSPKLSARSLRIEASGVKKISTKTPLGPSGDTKFKGNLDASGRKAKGKGVYQYTKKYGANVDGYSPI
ncbi:photosystem II protein PsbR, partial [Salmonella sp. s23851]|uniref:photosystem II protein PsbR n=1 Tax=Salmonella sp. s23851 TaxID=3159631 RepID=UPI0039818E47